MDGQSLDNDDDDDEKTGNSTRREAKRQTEETIGQHQSGLALNGTSYCGKLRTARSGGSWL